MEEKKYGKIALRNSDMYREYRDILQVILDKDKEYTLDEVDELISCFLERSVK